MNIRRIIGIDVGEKRVGMAQSDPTQTFATPIGTFPPDESLRKLEAIRNQIDLIVVGWPLSLKGHEGGSTEMVTRFVNQLRKKFPELSVHLLDERFTSSIATRSIQEAVPSRKKRQDKGLVDTVAAAVLLQSYLDKPSR